MRTWIALLAAGMALAQAGASEQSMQDKALAVSQAAVGNALPELEFVDTRGRAVNLADFRGRPLLVTLVYTGCADICPALIESLYPAVRTAQEAFGEDSFAVITIGFDTRHDSAERMRSFARQNGVDLPNWFFLAGTSASVEQLSDAVGFTIVPSAGGFEHMAQVSFVDRDGRIYQQLYGGVFSTPAVVEPLKDLVFGRTRSILSFAGIADRVKLFCTVFNPNTGRYYFNYSLFIGLAIGIACLLLVLSWLVREFLRSRGPGQGVA